MSNGVFFITQDPDMSTPSIDDGGTSASFSKEPRGRLVGRIRLVSTRPERSIFTSTGVPGLKPCDDLQQLIGSAHGGAAYFKDDVEAAKICVGSGRVGQNPFDQHA